MTVNKAVKCLQQQQSKLPIEKGNEQIWRNQTMSYLKSFFGNGSDEHKFIMGFSFGQDSESYYSEHWGRFIINKSYVGNDKQKEAYLFIDYCIETLKAKGLHKDSKKEFLNRYSDKEIIFSFLTAFIFIGGLCYTVGQITSNNKIDRLEFENQKLKDTISTMKIISDKTKVIDLPKSGSNQKK